MNILLIVVSAVTSIACGVLLWRFATLSRQFAGYSIVAISFVVAAYSFSSLQLELGGDLEAILFLIYWLGPVYLGLLIARSWESVSRQCEDDEWRSAFSSEG